MHKARKEIADSLKRCDVVVEVVDARLPWSSSNPLLAELRQHRQRPCVKVLTKIDLADPLITQRWLSWHQAQAHVAAVALNLTRPQEAKKLLPLARKLAPHRNSLEKPLRLMVAGIPNVGKSTLINALAGRKIAKTGDEPAITKRQQWVDLGGGVELLDTPGILWPKIAHPASGLRLAAAHAIGKGAMDEVGVALFVIEHLQALYPATLESRYKIANPTSLASDEVLEQIAQKRGFRSSGGRFDLTKAAEVVLYELRNAQIGRISFETPDDVAELESAALSPDMDEDDGESNDLGEPGDTDTELNDGA